REAARPGGRAARGRCGDAGRAAEGRLGHHVLHPLARPAARRRADPVLALHHDPYRRVRDPRDRLGRPARHSDRLAMPVRSPGRLGRRAALLPIPAALAGCTGMQSMLETHGPEAEWIALIAWIVFVGGTAIFVGVMALAAYAL